jgi:hypothetical protein
VWKHLKVESTGSTEETMISLIPLLIDEPQMPREARDALVVAELAADPRVAARAKVKAGNILARELGLGLQELCELLGLPAPTLNGQAP